MVMRRLGGPGMHGVGGVPLSSLGGGALKSYADKVLGYGPIAYWPLWDTAGAATCLVNPLQNGTYNGPILANGSGPDGSPCPWFDGANDFVDVFTATLAGVFTGNLNTVCIWSKVNAAGSWTDGVIRELHRFRFTAAGGYLRAFKTNAANALQWTRFDGVGAQNVGTGGHADTGWMLIAQTLTVAGNQYKAFKNAVQENGTQVGLGNMGAALDQAYLGDSTGGGAAPWHGWLAHAMVFPYVLSQPQLQDLAAI